MSTLAEFLLDAGPAAVVLAAAHLFNRAADTDGNRTADLIGDQGTTFDWWWTAEPPDIAAHEQAAEPS